MAAVTDAVTSPPEGRPMEKIKASSLGTKLVLVAGPLLLLSLFFTWQNLEVDYGAAGVAVLTQDGWDVWGLLIGLLSITIVTLVVLTRLTEVEMTEDVSWDSIILGLGGACAALAVVKNLTDANSSWESYVFVGFAVLVFAGTYLNWAEARRSARPLLRRRRGGFGSAA